MFFITLDFVDNSFKDFEKRGYLQSNSAFQNEINLAFDTFLKRFNYTQDIHLICQIVCSREIKRTMAGTCNLGINVGCDENFLIYEPSFLSKCKNIESEHFKKNRFDMQIFINCEVADRELEIAKDDISKDKKDFKSMIMHEIMHGFGVAGYRILNGEKIGGFIGNKKTTFDAKSDIINNSCYFLGEHTKNFLQKELKLSFYDTTDIISYSNFYHVDENFTNSIINPALPYGIKKEPLEIDFYILKDLGYDIKI